MAHAGKNGKKLRKLWTDDPKCYYCKRTTVLVQVASNERMPKTFAEYPLRATIEHLRSRFDETRQDPIQDENDRRIVLACNECNFKRGIEEVMKNKEARRKLQKEMDAKRRKQRNAAKRNGSCES